MSASPIIILDMRRVKKTAKYPVKLRVSYKGISRDFQTIFDMNEEEFEKRDAPNPGKEIREIREQLNLLRNKAETICSEMRSFTFKNFEFEIYGGNHCLKSKKQKKENYTHLTANFILNPSKRGLKSYPKYILTNTIYPIPTLNTFKTCSNRNALHLL